MIFAPEYVHTNFMTIFAMNVFVGAKKDTVKWKRKKIREQDLFQELFLVTLSLFFLRKLFYNVASSHGRSLLYSASIIHVSNIRFMAVVLNVGNTLITKEFFLAF